MSKSVTFQEILCHCGCKRPSVVTMDYQKATPSKAGPFTLAPRINRVCTTCWTHWFGAPGKVKQFTRVEWDRLLEAA